MIHSRPERRDRRTEETSVLDALLSRKVEATMLVLEGVYVAGDEAGILAV